MTPQSALTALIVASVAVTAPLGALAPAAHAVPAPEVEYLYDVGVRRHYNFPQGDALGYGHGICEKVLQGNSYAQVAEDVRRDLATDDEYGVSYLISNAVGILCPSLVWQLRNSAAHYRPPGQ